MSFTYDQYKQIHQTSTVAYQAVMDAGEIPEDGMEVISLINHQVLSSLGFVNLEDIPSILEVHGMAGMYVMALRHPERFLADINFWKNKVRLEHNFVDFIMQNDDSSAKDAFYRSSDMTLGRMFLVNPSILIRGIA